MKTINKKYKRKQALKISKREIEILKLKHNIREIILKKRSKIYEEKIKNILKNFHALLRLNFLKQK